MRFKDPLHRTAQERLEGSTSSRAPTKGTTVEAVVGRNRPVACSRLRQVGVAPVELSVSECACEVEPLSGYEPIHTRVTERWCEVSSSVQVGLF